MICRQLIRIFATDKIACGINARDFLFGKSKKEDNMYVVLDHKSNAEISNDNPYKNFEVPFYSN